ncbi:MULTISPECIES: DVU0298 family protein [unclassified Adlercreutzia]|uniref:DVU0298 family protein n=1 Tax=unclassified Adlercreutzia TaxID=2636013 RepID=UPI0013EDFAE0|nr:MULTISPECIES: DVU0298 family protein [unclassified Adlercreutzia]
MFSKDEVRALVAREDFDGLLRLFDADADRVRRFLTRLTYAPGTREHAAAIRCFERLCACRSGGAEEFFRETMRRHIWAMNEEGANVAWSAPEIICAIIAGNPAAYGAFFSYAFEAAVDEPTFQPSLLAGCEMVARAAPELVRGREEEIARLAAAVRERGA